MRKESLKSSRSAPRTRGSLRHWKWLGHLQTMCQLGLAQKISFTVESSICLSIQGRRRGWTAMTLAVFLAG